MRGRAMQRGWLFCVLALACAVARADALPSWNDGPARQRIVEFVTTVTDPTSPSYVPPAERIAVLDNDGTLWTEQPMYFQLAFVLDRVRQLAPQHPEWQTTEPFRSVLAGDLAGLHAAGEAGLLQLVAATHAGTTSDEFQRIVQQWFAEARHPRYGRPYTELAYVPMQELLAFRTRYEPRDGAGVVVRLPEIEFIDDKAGKPVGIQRHIGRRPILAFGNSDGDFEMLEFTTAGPGPRLALILHHDDAGREYAYDRDSSVGRLVRGLDEAGKRGWTVVSMKNDWRKVHEAPARGR